MGIEGNVKKWQLLNVNGGGEVSLLRFRRFGSHSFGLSCGLVYVWGAYVVSQGNITATILWFAITTGATAGLGGYKEKEH